jgi:hypothetical protein
MATALPASNELLAVRTLEARCCDMPKPQVYIERRIFSEDHRIICENCTQELKIKREVFLAPL